MPQASPSSRRIAPATIALAAAALIALVVIVIAVNRGSGEAVTAAANSAAAAAPAGPAPEQAPQQAIADLQRRLQADPDNAGLWFELGGQYRSLGAAAEAEGAFRRAMELQPRNPEYITYLGEAVLMKQQDDAGLRQAEQLFNRALAIDPRNPMTRYYAATMKDQRGQHRQAIDDLIALLRDAPPGAAWEVNVRRSIENIAQARGIDVSGRLPPPSPGSVASAAIPGPTAEQMDAARSIPPSQQDQMVQGMVERLAARLQANPRDERGWMMLMRSRMVLNDRAGAGQALAGGLAAFQDDAAAQQRLRQAAAQLGVTEG